LTLINRAEYYRCHMMMRLVICTLVTWFLAGCSSAEKLDTNTPEGGFKLGEKLEKDERFEEAINQFNIVTNKHPYSRLAIEAKLRVADIQFKREDYLEAQNSYQSFKEMHPTHPRADYVTFRLGLSFFNQLPSTIDRDLALADRAILYFDEVLQSYGSSPHAKEAAEYRRKALVMLAEKEHYIAHFYFVRDHYESALGRYESLLERFPDLGFDARALYGAAYSAFKIRELAKAKGFYDQLIRRFPSTSEAEKARQQLGNRI
jgi:outer membrane protein assembly factor BamD